MFYTVFLLHCLIFVCTKCLSGCMTLLQIIAVSTHIFIYFFFTENQAWAQGTPAKSPKAQNYIVSFNHDVKLPHKKWSKTLENKAIWLVKGIYGIEL